MTKSEMAAKMASDLAAFTSRASITTLAPETAQDIRDKRAQQRYYNDSQYDAETCGMYRDEHGRMANSPQNYVGWERS